MQKEIWDEIESIVELLMATFLRGICARLGNAKLGGYCGGVSGLLIKEVQLRSMAHLACGCKLRILFDDVGKFFL